MKYVLSVLLFMSCVSASVIEYAPAKVYTVVGQTKDMTLHDNTLLISTGSGTVHIYDITSDVEVKRIELEKVKDFVGDLTAPKIFSVDTFSVDKNEQKYLLLSDSGKGGYTNLWIHEHNKTKNILNASHKIAALKARFVDNTHVLVGLLSNEAVLVDIEAKKVLYTVQLEPSKFSDFSLNEDRTKAVFACESGILSIIDTLTGKEIQKLKGVNVDNVYKVDFKNGIVSAAGQDRRGGLYDIAFGMQTYIEGSFLIYATALSPSAKKVAFTMDEKNSISIYNRNTKQKIAVLKGQKSTLNTILFKDENTIFTASDDNAVMVWKIK